MQVTSHCVRRKRQNPAKERMENYKSRNQGMAVTEMTKEAISQAVAEAAKTVVMAISRGSRRQNIKVEHTGTSELSKEWGTP